MGWRQLERLSLEFRPEIQGLLDTLAELLPPPESGGYEAFLKWLRVAGHAGLLTELERSSVVGEIGRLSG